MRDIDKRLDKILREYIYDDHENCDDSCGKKAYYGELIQAIKQLIQSATTEARIDELNKITTEYGSYNDGCGCCMNETIRGWNDEEDGYSGELRSQWLIDRLKELQSLQNKKEKE